MLTPRQYKLARKTVSANAFFMMTMTALQEKFAESCIRMADGERMLLQECLKHHHKELLPPPPGYTKDWMVAYGVDGITAGELLMRLTYAATECTDFAPSVSGFFDEKYNMHSFWPERDHYIDNFFVDLWTTEQKTELFQKAGHVLLIHRNAHTADSMQLRVQANLEVKVHYIPLDNWRQTEDVIRKANENAAPLVLFSGGPAGKYIAPRISKEGTHPKVVLDIGHGADRWTFNHLPIDRPKAEAFHARWAATQEKQAVAAAG